MNKQYVEMLGKQIELEVSRSAEQSLSERDVPFYVEMELYFSCLLRKRIRVYETLVEPAGENFSVRYSDKLQINFRPVMTKTCSISSCENGKPPLSDFPVQKLQSYIPRWLKLDFYKGKWCGDYGY
jgi:hypothetical protein